jgi:membrane protease YdiL (CAAX protease family)
MNSLVTVECFDYPTQAQVAQLELESHGIQCCLSDETIVAMDWFLSNAVGGVKLQVKHEDVARAVEILNELRRKSIERKDANKEKWVAISCSRCNKPIAFSGDKIGTVQDCPRCGRYVDVPSETDPNLEPTIVEDTVREFRDGMRATATGCGAKFYLYLEVLFVLFIGYFPDMAAALTDSHEQGSITAQDLDSHQSYFDLIGRSLFVLLCMIPVYVAASFLLKGSKKVEGKSSFLLRVTCDIGMGLVLGAAILASEITFMNWMYPAPMGVGIGQLLSSMRSRWLEAGFETIVLSFVALVLNSMAEELVMRKYLIDRCERIFGSTIFAVIATSLLFGSYHIYMGTIGVLFATITGLVFGIYFVYTRRILGLIVAHTLMNILIAAINSAA